LHAAALETDTGAGAPLGSAVDKDKPGAAVMRALATLLAPIGADRARPAGGGADVNPMGEAGVPLVSYQTDMSRYFDYHHSQADTLDKVDRDELRKNVAALAVTAYLLADMPGRLDR
jgi:carboxypeptidase Q